MNEKLKRRFVNKLHFVFDLYKDHWSGLNESFNTLWTYSKNHVKLFEINLPCILMMKIRTKSMQYAYYRIILTKKYSLKSGLICRQFVKALKVDDARLVTKICCAAKAHIA